MSAEAKGVRWARRVRVWGSPPPGAAPAPGADLILHASFADTALLPYGTLLDDWLGPAERAALDAAANADLAAWRAETEAALTVAGTSVGGLFEGELYADVFLRERFALSGLERAFADSPPEKVELRRVDADLATAAEAALAQLGIRADVHDEAAPPTYPIAYASSIQGGSRVAGAVREVVGAPAVVRGEVLILPAPALAPLWGAFESAGTRPVVDLVNPPSTGTARRAARAGWIAHPGARLRRAARNGLTEALERLDPPKLTETDPLAWLQRRRAPGLLAARAPEVLAREAALRRTFARRRLRAAVLPSDGTASGRALIAAAATAGVPVTHVQHGFFSDLWRLDGDPAPYVDGLVADRAGVWSEAHRRRLAPHASGRVEVTGNPAAAGLSATGAPPPEGGPALVLVQPPGIGTPAVDQRAPRRFAEAALAGLAAAAPRLAVALRPHPLDRTDCAAIAAASEVERWEVVAEGPFEPLLERAAVCVGPASTATLQAAAAGVPTVHLDVTGAALPSPFDGSGALPRATDSSSLAAALAPGGPRADLEAARAALGALPDAAERVVELALA